MTSAWWRDQLGMSSGPAGYAPHSRDVTLAPSVRDDACSTEPVLESTNTPELRTPRSERVSLLYICYLGIAEPLVQTQVIPYLGGLSAAGYGVRLLTFEPHPLSTNERRTYLDLLRRLEIGWYTLRYHKRPALPATLVDVVVGIMYAAYLVRKLHVHVIHARGHVPAVMGLILKRLLKTRFVFDIRGLMAEEYVDAGLWRRHGLLFRFVKHLEKMLLREADAAVVLTRRARRWLFDVGAAGADHQAPVEAIPCCVDLQRFRVDQSRARALRSSLDLDGGPVIVYAGKFGGWYMTREMIDFFCTAQSQFPGLRFLILTQSPTAIVEEQLIRRRVDRTAYRCLKVSPADLPTYLAVADFAISFRVPGFSQIAASPTKMGEYLAAGLPVAYNSGIGDLEDLEDDEVGAVVRAFNEAAYEQAARRMRALLDARDQTARRCRAIATRHFSLASVGIPGYLRLYAALTGAFPTPTSAAEGGAPGVRGVVEESGPR